jgi:hypothetical protein
LLLLKNRLSLNKIGSFCTIFPNRRYLLKFGATNGQDSGLEVRNAQFEHIGSCSTADIDALAAMLDQKLSPVQVQALLDQTPFGIITPIDL